MCFVLMLCLGSMAAAMPHGDDYDKALDKYAVICDRCVELRAKTESGQSVRMEELKVLLAELSSLRKTLSNASGKMSPAQVARFEAIKAKYLQGMKSFERPAGTEPGEKTVRQPFDPLPKIASPVTEPVEVTSSAFRTKSLRQAQRPEGQAQRPDGQAGRHSTFARKHTKPFGFAALADAGIFPNPSYGAMAVATWKGLGVYLNCQSDFRKNEYSYVCTGDGDTEYGRIWATGKSRESRTVATAGFAMFTSRRFGFHAGAGVTSYTRCWEDVSGQWAKVEDKSFKSLAADVGIFLTFKPLILSIGVVSDFSGHADARVGVGVRF